MSRQALPLRRQNAVRPVYVDPQDYDKAAQIGLHVSGTPPIPLLTSVSHHGGEARVHVFAQHAPISVYLSVEDAPRFVGRD